MVLSKKRKLYILIVLFILAISGVFVSLDFSSASASAEGLKGSGTKSDPYLVETSEDFISFAESVNGGNSHEGEYFLQTADIDFKSRPVSPVGTYDGGDYFYGIYDGGGYAMYNLVIDEGRDGYAGLFGTLGGTVRNLGIESGKITGYCVGSFASNADSGVAEIVNCYSKAEIVSYLRGGGIADNFKGLVYNCVSMAINNGEYADLCSYNGRIVYNSYTLGENINAVDNGQTVKESSKTDEDTLKSEEFALTMNKGIFAVAEEKGDMFFYRDYSFWEIQDENLSFTQRYVYELPEELEGEGSKDEPYLISSASDFFYLIDKVNSGERYEGKYFKQTQNINFNYIPMKSVAVVGTGTAFSGTYDGNGHYIYNYCVDNTADYNAGLFGLIGGKIINLGLEHGYIFGACLGGIAVNSQYGYTVIYNCYSKAEMYGFRGGGIVDNFSGLVANCVSDATFNGKSAPLAAYLLREVEGCYSTGKIVDTGYFEKSENNIMISREMLYSSDISDKMNKNAEEISLGYGLCSLENTAAWKLEEGGFFGFLDNSAYNPKSYFKGKGSKGNPYIIASEEDFIFFHDSVNAGFAYNGRYVKQTVNLDFKGEELNPVSIYDSGNYFYGTYDGNGHIIENLDITQKFGRQMTGLFGSLAGFVYNLGYVSGTVYGEISGGIANYGSTAEGAIINCYFTGKISAYRASGIADSFRGRIINCWCDGKNILTGEKYPLNAIVATKIIHSFSTGELNAMGYTDNEVDSSVIDEDLLKDERFAVILNAGCLYTARENICTLQSLNEWGIKDGKIRQGDNFKKSYSSYISAFKGLGTKWNPYKIESADDLVLLQLTTAAGEKYKNQYFVQTCDIDCKNITSGIPIGELASHVFYAEYNGQGYEIKNLELNSSIYDGSCSFIRTLGGTVKNLYIKNCTFVGDTAAGVACYTDNLANTRIINCIITDSVIIGYKTSAGLVCYGRETRVYNCLYISYDARSSEYFCLQADKLFGCYTNVFFNDGDYKYIIMDSCERIDGINVTIKDVIDKMNSNIVKLKTLLNENIVGVFARFAADGKEGVRFDGFFRITPFNLGECMKVLGYDVSLYMALVVGIILIIASVMVDMYLSRVRKERAREAARSQTDEFVPDAMIDYSIEQFYEKRQTAVSKTENKLIGRRIRSEVDKDTSRISVTLYSSKEDRKNRKAASDENRRQKKQAKSSIKKVKNDNPGRIYSDKDGE